MIIKIVPDPRGVKGKLADVELHFVDGELAGLKLLGFAVWQRRVTDMAPVSQAVRDNARTVSFPARNYSINGDRRSFALLRPLIAISSNQDFQLTRAILRAYDTFVSESNPSALFEARTACRYCGASRPEGYQNTCGRSACQQEDYEYSGFANGAKS